MALSDSEQERLRSVEVGLKELAAETRTTLATTWKWLAVFVPVITAIVTGLLTVVGGWVAHRALSGLDEVKTGIGELKTQYASQSERTAALKDQRTADSAYVEKALDKLERRIEELGKARHVATAFKRGKFDSIVQETYIVGDPPKTRIVTTLVAKTGNDRGWLCSLGPETRVLIDGTPAKREDLKRGMHVEVVLDDGNTAVLVSAWTTEPIPGPKSMPGAEPVGKPLPVDE